MKLYLPHTIYSRNFSISKERRRFRFRNDKVHARNSTLHWKMFQAIEAPPTPPLIDRHSWHRKPMRVLVSQRILFNLLVKFFACYSASLRRFLTNRKISTIVKKKKFLTRPGIEPGSHPWQARILTTILRRIRKGQKDWLTREIYIERKLTWWLATAFGEKRVDLDAFVIARTDQTAVTAIVTKERPPVIAPIRPERLLAVRAFLLVSVRKVACNYMSMQLLIWRMFVPLAIYQLINLVDL